MDKTTKMAGGREVIFTFACKTIKIIMKIIHAHHQGGQPWILPG